MSRNNRFVYAWQRGVKAQPQNGGGRFRPLEATRDYKNPTAIQKAEWQSTVSPRLLLNAMGGYAGYITDYDAGRSYARPDAPSRQDLETTLFTGSHVQHQGKTRDRYQAEASASFFPARSFGGQHDFKTGVSIYWDRTSDDWLNNVAGNYVLITDRIAGVSGTPFRIRAYNTPAAPKDNEDIYAWYFKDSWRPTSKLTLNLGVRWEYQHSYLPEQYYAGARDFPTVFPAKHVDKLDVQTFNRVVPRLGVAYDLGGKSVVKATWGLYNYILGDTYGDVFAATATANAVFLWHDLNGDKLWTPNETNLALNNSPDFVSITAASNYELSPELKQPNTWESTVSFERELAPSLGFRVMYINKIVDDTIELVNTKRPNNAYSVPITRRDPGPDGVLGNADDGGRITLYDYAASYRGAAFVSTKRVNAETTDRFHSMEFTLTKRASSRWMGQISYFAVKNHRWLEGSCCGAGSAVIANPNDEFFPLDETWSWAGNVSASYRLPYDVSVSGFLQSRSGVKGQRTNIFRTADPDGGPSIAQNGNTTIRLEPYGSQRAVCLQHPQLPGEQGFPVERRSEARHRFRCVQPVEFRDADWRRFRVGSDVRLRNRRGASAHYAHRRAVHVLRNENEAISMRMCDANAYMRVTTFVFVAGAVVSVVAALVVSPVSSPDLNAANQATAPLTCNLTQYKASTGLTTALEGDLLTVSWNGQGTSQLRARFAIDGGTPTVRDLSVRRGSGEWAMLGQNLTPEYQVTTGVRRMSNDLANAFASLGIDVTQEVIDKNRWYAFWDAPFSIPGYYPATARGGGGPTRRASGTDAGTGWDRR